MDANILIVDDEEPVRLLLSRYLEKAGYNYKSADSAKSAKALLAADTFNLLLCDLKMPGESGLELIKFAKENYPEVGRVIITSIDSPEVASEVMEVGVYGYVIKPFTSNIVMITVENALRHLRLDHHMNSCKIELEKKISVRAEKLAAIMNNISVGVLMLDLDMNILEMNSKMEELFFQGLPKKSSLCYKVFNDLNRDEICDNCPMERTFKTGKVSEAVRKIVSKHGKLDFRIVASPIFNEKGEIYAGILLYEDITERLVMERDLHQAQKLESVGQLAAGIAHEINSPIQFIGDNINFLSEAFRDLSEVVNQYNYSWNTISKSCDIPIKIEQKLAKTLEDADIEFLEKEIPETVEQCLDGIQRVDRIVRGMKMFSHPGDEKKTLVDINKIIESTATVCRNEWKYVAKIKLNLSPELPMTPCFSGEISQVFLNIIVNAAHAIANSIENSDKEVGEIAISSAKTESGIEIRISDTGGGIPESIQDRVFDPFFTTKELGKGTGQGLAIAHRVVVEKHQGTIFFTSEAGQGTTFIINLPDH